MRIQHNISALNAYRQLGNNNSSVSKNLEKLSSGYRINRAGDDAAGLAISEKMRAQIKGLETAQKNANDGISLVQTAEGALTEVHSMLNRMVELATQSANGTYDDTTDRVNLQKEIVSLKDEIDRISDGTNFNGINLLDGSMGMNENAFSVTDANAVAAGRIGSITATRPGQESQTVQKESFVISLSDLKFTTSNATATTGTFTLNVGGTAITATVNVNSSTAATASQIATALQGSNSVVTIGGNAYDVTVENGNGLKFTMKNNPTSDATQGAGVYTVTVGSLGADYGTENDILDNATVITAGRKPIAGGLAEADITLDINAIQDGSTLKIGTTTYQFDFKGGSSASAGNVQVNLSTLDREKATGKDILDALTRASAGKPWEIGKVNDDGRITIRQKAGSTEVYDTNNEVAEQIEFGTTAAKNAGKTIDIISARDLKVGNSITVGDKIYEFTEAGKASNNSKATRIEIAGLSDGSATAADIANALNTKLNADGFSSTIDGTKVTIRAANADDLAPEVSGGGLSLQVGDSNESFQKVNVRIGSMNTATLGIGSIDISTQQGASDAIKKIKDAINKVSSTRGDLGAIQNRLDHTINNLGVTTENMTAAESRIRDVDMAKEMMDFTKNNILVQASQAMLAQANQIPQGVLQLLQ